MRAEFALATALLLCGAQARAYTSPAPDVVVFAEPTLRSAIEAVGALFEAQTGAPVVLLTAPSVMLLGQIPHTRDDVMILQGDATIATAVAQKIAAPAPLVAFGRNHLVVAKKGAGTAQPLSALAVSGTVAIVDEPVPDALGALSHGVLGPLAWPPAGTKVSGVARDADATFLLQRGEAALAVVYTTDVAANPALSVAATLPDPATPITYTAALSADNNSANAGKFLDFLRSPAAVAKLRAAGLEVAAP
jgi:molybdate transport system substrate-binding protein